jgi:N-methylhydantoinase A/oxoprolinase/acetone carboxylase beta subunit
VSGLRIGIDVGGTFTHGVLLEPPGTVIATARTPTTHGHPQGVAFGVRQVLTELAALAADATIELVSHSTTQATNALLEGDLAPVGLLGAAPPGELGACRLALPRQQLRLGGSHSIALNTHVAPLPVLVVGDVPDFDNTQPLVIIEALAHGQPPREHEIARHYTGRTFEPLCAADITQVLGLAARARTAILNASMLPAMLRTAEFTATAVEHVLPGVPLVVVRSDGGSMPLSAMERQPILSLLSGPAAGAGVAISSTGLSEVVFIEVGGTSTDITLVKEGRVRQRYATVAGQRLMVPALDLRTVPAGGGSMLRADGRSFGPRSAHIAGLPYLFQALGDGRTPREPVEWRDPGTGTRYTVLKLDDGSHAAITPTDCHLAAPPERGIDPARELLGDTLPGGVQPALMRICYDELGSTVRTAWKGTIAIIQRAVLSLVRQHRAHLPLFTLAGAGGGAPLFLAGVGQELGIPQELVEHHTVASAIGAALALNTATASRSVAAPSPGVVSELAEQVKAQLSAAGSARMELDVDFDAHRQVLTVTGRAARSYSQGQAKSDDALALHAQAFTGGQGECIYSEPGMLLFAAPATRPGRRAVLLARDGHCLWHGYLKHFAPAAPGRLPDVLRQVVSSQTVYTDGGAELPGLAVATGGRFIPLDALASAELALSMLALDGSGTDAPACVLLRA